MFHYAIDLGGGFTTIYKKNAGFVLKEPTMIAVEQSKGVYNVKTIGEDAKKLVWKTHESIDVFNPISNGVIENFEYAKIILSHFLKKVEFKKNKFNVLVLVHCGISKQEKRLYKKLFEEVGFLDVILIPSILCSAYGAERNISSSKASVIVNIGSTTTEIAAINLNSIIQGVSLGIGGKIMDIEIANIIALSKTNGGGLLIGLPTAEKIKNEVGSLYNNDCLNIEVHGTSIETKSPSTKIVTSQDVKKVIQAFLEEIIRSIEVTITTLPPEMTADILNAGILFTGGVANMVGFEEFLKKHLSFPFVVAKNPEDVTILGAGKILSDLDLVSSIIKNN